MANKETIEKTYRKNRHKLNHNLHVNNPFRDCLSVCKNESCNNKKDNDNQELVILAKQTLTQAQKDVLTVYPSYLHQRN